MKCRCLRKGIYSRTQREETEEDDRVEKYDSISDKTLRFLPAECGLQSELSQWFACDVPHGRSKTPGVCVCTASLDGQS